MKILFFLPLLFLLSLVVVVANGGEVDSSSSRWCLPKPGISTEQLRDVLDYVCTKVPCQESDMCFTDLSVRTGFAMNMYFQLNGRSEESYIFGGAGMVVTTNASTAGGCNYVSAAAAAAIIPSAQETMVVLMMIRVFLFI
ncbi:hypothetical protein Rs2_07848 [Raphanus sativus]|uniref:Major pollen allergen Ole e 10-like n=1 Tax=Raphanus sativus TaxID=3726 RepID=A0A9W3DA92_RAPSA|nr:major pollen allergen Ole e 10-like [Raphanus sativus]KAJ4913227.1 hypothetical protein Rs2_07848 [Raphanus sativus]